MQYYSTSELRKKWIDFFKSKDHLLVESKSLIPNNDPSLLWINSGVATLKNYFTGIENPPHNRLVNCQRSIRTNDIENVGVTSRHHTFFEMLGNFSIGDYFKLEAIAYGYEFLTKVLEIPLEKLYITVFVEDDLAYNQWIKLGIIPSHIIKNNKDRNFWDVGQGPCGPCTEIFFDRGEKYDPNHIGEKLFFDDIENDRYIEIWNIVFSEFNNDGQNNYTELARKNIDTGAGLERLACVFQEVPTNYETDTFIKVINALENVSQQKYDKQAYFSNEYAQKEINRCYRVIVDHVKSCVFAISDGAIISNKERGAILRRLIRRSIIASRKIGSSKDFLPIVVDEIVTQYKDFYPYLTSTRQNVIQALESERKLFEETIDKGYALFNDEINSKNELSGEVIFKLVSTYGFPIELIEELCKENNIKLNKEEYFNKFTQHQEISRAHVVRTGMSEQVDSLINFKEPSNFLYDQLELQNVKITGIFDEKYNLVNSIHGKLWLAFHQTVFYATSGGQIHDKGSISVNGNKYAVLDVVKAPNGQHLHLIDALDRQITTNEPCDLKVDPIFRTNVSRNHTAEHILEHVMNKNIDTSIKQEGAFKTDTYFTFDFKLNYKLSSEQLKLIENKVNEIINNENEINVILKSHDELANANVVGHFTEKYKSIKGDLRVVCIKGVNDEICGGTHVNNTKDLEKFMIVEYTPKGTGFWRIRGITSNNTTSKYIDEQIEIIELQINKIKAKVNELKIDNKLLNELINEINYHSSTKNLIELEKQLNKIKEISDEEFKKSAKLNEGNIIAEIKATDKMFSSSGVICYFSVHDKPIKLIAFALNELSNEDSKYLYVVLNILNDKIQYCLIANSKDIAIKPNEFIKKINLICDGSGGGNELFAQGGTNKVEKTVELLDFIKSN